MSEKPRSVLARARQLARSGKFIGWRAIAFELQFEPGFEEASQWIDSAANQDELDNICREARKRQRDTEAA